VVEVVEVELARGLRGPEPEVVHRVVPVAGNGGVVRHGHDLFGVEPVAPKPTHRVDGVLDPPVEPHGVEVLRTVDLPGVPVAEPVVRFFHLVPFTYPLEKNSVLVADAVAVGGQPECGHGIHEAGREPPQTPVPETRVELGLLQLLEPETQLVERLLHALPEAQIQDRVPQGPPHEKLEGEVINPFGGFPIVGLLRLDPALDEPVPHGEREAFEEVVASRAVLVFLEGILDVIDEGVHERLRVGPLERVRRGRELPDDGLLLGHDFSPFSQAFAATRRRSRCEHLTLERRAGQRDSTSAGLLTPTGCGVNVYTWPCRRISSE
jgi:hypothetical protein